MFSRGICSTCKGKKLSDTTVQEKGLSKFFKATGEVAVGFGKKVANNPGRALEVGAYLATAFASRKPSAVLSQTPDLIKFATTGKCITIADKNSRKPIAVFVPKVRRQGPHKGNYSSTWNGNGLYLEERKDRAVYTITQYILYLIFACDS